MEVIFYNNEGVCMFILNAKEDVSEREVKILCENIVSMFTAVDDREDDNEISYVINK